MSAIWIALLATVLIGFAGLASDTGVIWVNRSLLQNSVDAAALAGAQDLSPLSGQAQGKTNAATTACNYATQLNAVSGMDGKVGTCSNKADVTFPDDSSIKATAYKTIQPMFGAVLGFAPAEVHASATAKVGSMKSSSCYFPLYQSKDMLTNGGLLAVPPAPTKLKFKNGNGDFMGVRLNGATGANDWRNAIASPDCPNVDGESVGDPLHLETGDMAGPMVQGISDRLNKLAGGPCVDPDPTKSPYSIKPDGTVWNGTTQLNTKNCYRMVLMPISKSQSDKTIAGFGVFWIAGYCDSTGQNGKCTPSNPPASLNMSKNEIWGFYVGMLAPGGVDYGTYDGFGTKVVALAS